MLKISEYSIQTPDIRQDAVDKTTIYVTGDDSSVTEKCETKKTDTEKENHNMAT
jgi:hypothetical protein